MNDISLVVTLIFIFSVMDQFSEVSVLKECREQCSLHIVEGFTEFSMSIGHVFFTNYLSIYSGICREICHCQVDDVPLSSGLQIPSKQLKCLTTVLPLSVGSAVGFQTQTTATQRLSSFRFTPINSISTVYSII